MLICAIALKNGVGPNENMASQMKSFRGQFGPVYTNFPRIIFAGSSSSSSFNDGQMRGSRSSQSILFNSARTAKIWAACRSRKCANYVTRLKIDCIRWASGALVSSNLIEACQRKRKRKFCIKTQRSPANCEAPSWLIRPNEESVS